LSGDGNTALVGASEDDTQAGYDYHSAGSAYVFVRNGSMWIQQAKLTASDGAGQDMFGSVVAVAGKRAAVGLPYKGGNGMVYLYEPAGNWANMTETSKLTAGDGAAGDAFGSAVALNTAAMVIGAFGDSEPNPGQGSAYVFAQPAIVRNVYLPICMR